MSKKDKAPNLKLNKKRVGEKEPVHNLEHEVKLVILIYYLFFLSIAFLFLIYGKRSFRFSYPNVTNFK